ncbi:unnamed protein product [Pieris brassicae]|uniref:Uncharacterized protein n=1 Tax=Pieris brassicae TaxID=7116 RepID=A0A9P0XFU8_PIEBR|nr:unnamed protein product [Pieris brassicae]
MSEQELDIDFLISLVQERPTSCVVETQAWHTMRCSVTTTRRNALMGPRSNLGGRDDGARLTGGHMATLKKPGH